MSNVTVRPKNIVHVTTETRMLCVTKAKFHGGVLPLRAQYHKKLTTSVSLGLLTSA